MKFLSKELVSFDYSDQLKRDLSRAAVCRFMVAYVSQEGLNALNRPLLIAALRGEKSFGVASLTCACSYEPLLNLQREVGTQPRLKYFMDPIVDKPDEPKTITLFHSKLVYLHLPRENKSVVYLGSHNWTRPALGAGSPRNAEASLRLEFDYLPEHLDGTAMDVPAEVNRHLLSAWDTPMCLPATAENEPKFQQWYDKGCRKANALPLELTTIILAVRTPRPDNNSVRWSDLRGRSIYMQVWEENDGGRVWNSEDRLLVCVWESREALQNAQQPMILKCRVSTSNAGPDSERRGTNRSATPIAGFRAVLFDEDQLALLQNRSLERVGARTWSGWNIEPYDFEFPSAQADSAAVDGDLRPKYQFNLEVEEVIFPSEDLSDEPKHYMWRRETLAVAEKKAHIRREETLGFHVDPELHDRNDELAHYRVAG